MLKKHDYREETLLKMNKEKFESQLAVQIQKGRELLKRHVDVYPAQVYSRLEKDLPVDEQALEILRNDYSLWNDYNIQLIMVAFTNNGGEYLESYKNSGLHLLYSTKNRVEQLKDFIREDVKELQSLINRLSLIPIQSPQPMTLINQNQINMDQVFVVHGHNEGINQEVARTIERLGLEAIILREQTNSSQTIIEKFESYARKVGFAVILLTADDKIEGETNFRARQNVIFEMGYFMGALGRSHVFCILQEKVEKPGDIDGVIYTPFDQAGAWKISLIKELRECGYNVDANKLL